MCGNKETFAILDETFRDSAKFGDNSKAAIMGRGQVRIQNKTNAVQPISNMLFVPSLKTNLLRIGQLQEKKIRSEDQGHYGQNSGYQARFDSLDTHVCR